MDPLQYNDYLKTFWEQKRLEEYQQRRELIRPNTTKLKVLLYSVLLLALCVVGIILLGYFSFHWVLKSIVLLVYILVLIETYGRFLSIKVVECYQHYASEEKRRSCKCIPSCSEYAIICFKKYEWVFALIKIRKRLFVTCKGFDYIIDEP